ncbi:ferredoxin--NADP reductase [Aridibaculum aurantiacum]|uniref:ferredoxin--NADP reductase n=1 Tax=Aridibaculum aurantiacum TaxID=2810307 RepID=UPI001A97CE40|nr:ferredoxin--NADP reductase [Aridibaculum aurantiacum]
MNFTLTVADIKRETSTAISLHFKQPALKKIKYKSGQYITLVVKINGRTYRRPYSISSVYGLDKTLNITVKAICDGVVSSYLLNNAKPGDAYEVMEPMGRFVCPDDKEVDHITCWSAGSGITPAWSIIRDVLHNKATTSVSLIYCNRNKESIIFGDEIQSLEKAFPDRLKVYHIFSKPVPGDDCFFEGRITRECVSQVMNYIHANSYHYLCGPVDMMDMIHHEILAHAPMSTVHFENFHNTVDPSALQGVMDADVAVDFEGRVHNVKVPFGKSILDACLDANIDIPYSCQTGSCTFCAATLLHGSLKTVTHQQPEKEIQQDEYLLCCSFPTQPHITIKA